MENYLKELEIKLNKAIKIEELKIIDNSYLHTGHKYFDKERFHIKLEIRSNHLNVLSRLEAQKKVMNILKEDLKTKIHALEIKIK